ncbi:MAG: ATP-binding protein [Rhodoferax sp.]|nr:ATP-binding protein [Rhodoferax sp.]
MKPNPGGQLAPQDIVGRDALIHDLKDILEQQSVLLVAERRVGKTHVLEKFKAMAPAGWVVIKRDLESIRSGREFVECTMADLYPHLEAKTNLRNWFQSLGEQAGGAQFGPIKLPNFAHRPWKQVLCDTIGHLHENPDIERLVFLWDELPWMLQGIAKTNPAEAMELLDTLRTLRQQNGNKLRMVFTGSLGLHHIIRALKAQGYANAPINDMQSIEVKPLSIEDAQGLVQQLFTDSQLEAEHPSLYAQTATAVDCMPYYIHHVVAAMVRKHRGQTNKLDWATISAMVTQSIQAPEDTWNLQHYEERTQEYYGTQRPQSLALLDAVASSTTPLSIGDVIKRAKGTHPNVEPEQWQDLIRLLQRDHYFARNDNGELDFKFSVVKRWWCWHRALPSSVQGAPL